MRGSPQFHEFPRRLEGDLLREDGDGDGLGDYKQTAYPPQTAIPADQQPVLMPEDGGWDLAPAPQDVSYYGEPSTAPQTADDGSGLAY